ncbi:hypothetical protein [Olsenella profusa]|uniref:Pyridine nucleotide-disulfide oxidoreductase domain protein n=1 Tax=Olsenella profusa F0195 TaxID=1125712 RepID=U2TXT3_9ACTN|nr:hypothetical protein [Olsenella profusa]ERL10813.1 hypothetical protein HMPREF1316_2222 [Olsenella profusa F0195]
MAPHTIEEADLPQLDGAQSGYGKPIESINERGPIFRTSILDGEGIVTARSDGCERIECDTVIICVSQVVPSKAWRASWASAWRMPW